MTTCDFDNCGAELVEKSRGRGYIVIGCRRGHNCYRTLDEATGKEIPQKGLAILRELTSDAQLAASP